MKKYFFLLIAIVINLNCTQNCQSFKKSATKIYGIDVSHYQDKISKINWEQVVQNKNPKIDFAYIRSTMGTDGKDKAFEYNIEQAEKNGLQVGVYHYYRPNENSTKQFENFLKNTPRIGDLPPVLDIEERSKFGAKNLKKGILNFLKLIETNYDVKPIIYAHQRFYNTYLRGCFPEYKIWIARQSGIKKQPDNNQPKKEPKLLDGRCAFIWQYSGTGNIDGITTDIDLNIVKGNW